MAKSILVLAYCIQVKETLQLCFYVRHQTSILKSRIESGHYTSIVNGGTRTLFNFMAMLAL